MIEPEMEVIVRDNFEKAVLSLVDDKRFIAIREYLELVYNIRLREFEFETSREALIQTGYKLCLREIIEDIEKNSIELTTTDEQW